MGGLGDPSDWPEQLSELRALDNLLRCPICYEYMQTAMIVPKCSHNYCSLCIRKYAGYKSQCPTCLESVSEPELCNNRTLDEIIKNFGEVRTKLLEIVRGTPLTEAQRTNVDEEKPGVSGGHGSGSRADASSRPLRKAARHRLVICDSEEEGDIQGHDPDYEDEKDVFITGTSPGSLATNKSASVKRRSLTEGRKFSKISAVSPARCLEPAPESGKTKAPLSGMFGQSESGIKTPDKHCTTPAREKSSGLLLNYSTPLGKPSPRSGSPLVSPPATPDVNANKVDCPVCGVGIPQRNINLHLDTCLTSGEKKNALRNKVAPKRKAMPKLVYSLIKDGDLRKKLAKIGLPTQGDRQALIKRHQEFTLIYNSQCDALEPKSAEDIIKEMTSAKKKVNQLPTLNTNQAKMVLPKGATTEQVEKAQEEYETKHKSQFNQLIAETRKRMKQTKTMQVSCNEAPPCLIKVPSLNSPCSSLASPPRLVHCGEAPPCETPMRLVTDDADPSGQTTSSLALEHAGDGTVDAVDGGREVESDSRPTGLYLASADMTLPLNHVMSTCDGGDDTVSPDLASSPTFPAGSGRGCATVTSVVGFTGLVTKTTMQSGSEESWQKDTDCDHTDGKLLSKNELCHDMQPHHDGETRPLSDENARPKSDEVTQPLSEEDARPMSDDDTQPMSDEDTQPMSDDDTRPPPGDDTRAHGTHDVTADQLATHVTTAVVPGDQDAGDIDLFCDTLSDGSSGGDSPSVLRQPDVPSTPSVAMTTVPARADDRVESGWTTKDDSNSRFSGSLQLTQRSCSGSQPPGGASNLSSDGYSDWAGVLPDGFSSALENATKEDNTKRKRKRGRQVAGAVSREPTSPVLEEPRKRPRVAATGARDAGGEAATDDPQPLSPSPPTLHPVDQNATETPIEALEGRRLSTRRGRGRGRGRRGGGGDKALVDLTGTSSALAKEAAVPARRGRTKRAAPVAVAMQEAADDVDVAGAATAAPPGEDWENNPAERRPKHSAQKATRKTTRTQRK